MVVRVPDPDGVCAELAARGTICDSRPEVGLRLGPHFFNTDEELHRAVDQIVELASGVGSTEPLKSGGAGLAGAGSGTE